MTKPQPLRDVICAACPAVYSRKEIISARNGESGQLEEDQSDATAGHPRDKIGPQAEGPGEFECPRGHRIDGNRSSQIPLLVVDPSGSSDLHTLSSLTWEADLLQVFGTSLTLRQGDFTPQPSSPPRQP